jgi:hypothetical protein
MNLPARKPMTVAEFLHGECKQGLRYEFEGIQPIAMTGDSRAHTAIQRSVAVSLEGGRRGLRASSAAAFLAPARQGPTASSDTLEYQATPSVQRYVIWSRIASPPRSLPASVEIGSARFSLMTRSCRYPK